MESESDPEFFDSFEIPPTPILTRQKKRKIMGDLEQAVLELAENVAKMGNHPPINLAPFVGKMDKRSFQSFIKEFNKIGTAYKWKKEELCRNLPIFLKGEASAIYDNVSNAKKENWQELVDEIAKNVGGSSTTYRRLINSRKQREGEGFSEFAQALMEYSDRAFPDAEGYSADMRKNILIDLFINGLDWKIREHLRRYDKPTSLSDAIALAMEEDQIQSDIKREQLANNSLKLINTVNQQFEDWEACNAVNYEERSGHRFGSQNRGFFNQPYHFNPFNRNFLINSIEETEIIQETIKIAFLAKIIEILGEEEDFPMKTILEDKITDQMIIEINNGDMKETTQGVGIEVMGEAAVVVVEDIE